MNFLQICSAGRSSLLAFKFSILSPKDKNLDEPFAQAEAMEKGDDISAEVDNFKEALANHV